MSLAASLRHLLRNAQFTHAKTLADHDDHTNAFDHFAAAAAAGITQAQYRLGRCYLLGLGVPPSIGQALRWFRQAAEAGDANAQTQLAELALQGIRDRRNPDLFDHATSGTDWDRAEHWCRTAIAAGSVEAKALLAYILTDGPADRRDPEAGEQLYHEAADAGCSRGKLGFAATLLRDGTLDHTEQAKALLNDAAAEGIAAAHHLLGMLAESGAIGPPDFPAAAEHYKQAAEHGHIPAQVRYGFALLHGRGTQRDTFHAETWLRKAALAGDAQAAAVIGYLYARETDNLPANYAEASMWLQRAAEAGHAAAARTLGRLLLLGLGTPKDVQQGTYWLKVAAKNGDTTAQTDLDQLTGAIAA